MASIKTRVIITITNSVTVIMSMLDIIPVAVDEGTRAGQLPHIPGLVLHHPSASDCQCLQVENSFMSVPSV